jgi:hypothetical protein
MTTDELLSDLRESETDLVRVIEAVVRDRLPYLVVSSHAVKAWKEREPQHFEKVSGWLAARNVAIVQV